MRLIFPRYMIWYDELNEGMFKITSTLEQDKVIIRGISSIEKAEQYIRGKIDDKILSLAYDDRIKRGDEGKGSNTNFVSPKFKKGGIKVMSKKVSVTADKTVEEVIEDLGASEEEVIEEIPEEVLVSIPDEPELKQKPSKERKVEKVQKKTKGDNMKLVKNVGTTQKLGISASWVFIFAKNETSKPKLSDEKIGNWMHAEFPQAKTDYGRWVSAMRQKYNRGGFGSVPKVLSTGLDSKEKTTKTPLVTPQVKEKVAPSKTIHPKLVKAQTKVKKSLKTKRK